MPPRPRYPSDDRKSRPFVRVHLTAKTHRKTAELFADPQLRGMLVGLWMLAAEAFAGKNGNRVCLDRSAIAWISGRHRPDIGSTWVRRLFDVMGYTCVTSGRCLIVEVRNFEQKQGFNSATPRGVRGALRENSAAPTPTPIPIPRREEKSENPVERTRTTPQHFDGGVGSGGLGPFVGPAADPPSLAHDETLGAAQRRLEQRRRAFEPSPGPLGNEIKALVRF